MGNRIASLRCKQLRCGRALDGVECAPEEHSCENQRIQKHKRDRVRVQAAPGKGAGVFATQTHSAGALVMEYRGEVVMRAKVEKRAELIGDKAWEYTMTLDKTERDVSKHVLLDSSFYGNIARYANHHCGGGNCVVERWEVNGAWRIGIFAKQKIAIGEEVTFDYFGGDHKIGDQLFFRCVCGADNCPHKSMGVGTAGQSTNARAGAAGQSRNAGTNASLSPERQRRNEERIREEHEIFAAGGFEGAESDSDSPAAAGARTGTGLAPPSERERAQGQGRLSATRTPSEQSEQASGSDEYMSERDLEHKSGEPLADEDGEAGARDTAAGGTLRWSQTMESSSEEEAEDGTAVPRAGTSWLLDHSAKSQFSRYQLPKLLIRIRGVVSDTVHDMFAK